MIEQINTKQLEVLSYQASKKGKDCCGDSFLVVTKPDYAIISIADGLGSGVQAKESSEIVMNVLDKHHNEDLHSILLKCNDSLRAKRGAAVAIIKIYFSLNEMVYAGIGNIKFTIISPSGKSTYPLPKMGFLSGKPISIQIQRFSYENESVFLMSSDGVGMIASKDLLSYHHSLQSIIDLVRQQNNGNDDVTVLVGKIK
ncbi:PP2C family serine/threonine-protein phosphatase [Bacillus pinisoli]|uniref:PP2C family serine/threonine-protein phosphatase n=1 Tax=Bacillus pinisoli TaxID=2901866 RepID=UPI001FF4145D|nr:PP2C family serine/threonine-protein phosphatase [Bacillus pinisoli]